VCRGVGARALKRILAAHAAAALIVVGAIAAPPAHAAKRPPVVMIVFDEFPVDSLLLPDGTIDSRRFPGFAALARHSTWFPNASTVYDSTQQAVPAMLAGRSPSPELTPSYLSHPHSVFTLLARHGWRVHSREEATTVCPPRLCPRVRNYGNPDYSILHRRRERLEATIRSLRRTRRPVFTFHHSILPHQPWSYLPSGRLRSGPKKFELPNFAFPTGFGDPFLTELNQQAHLLQVGFVDREVGRLVRRLARQKLLDRALVLVTADHGIAFQVGVSDRRSVTESNVDQIAPVPLFVKAPGQRYGHVNHAYASALDVLPTIAGLLRLPLGRKLPGSSVFGKTVRARRRVRIIARDFSHAISVPAVQMESRRSGVRRRRTRVFGSGPWAGVFRIGPHQDLLDHSVSRVARTSSGVGATFVLPRRSSDVDPRASSVPTLAAGRLAGGMPGQTRDLALAVNGEVRAVGRSVRLKYDSNEYFSLTFPEQYLRRGSNLYELFEVTGARPDERLASLGAAGG
jgi:hypothetical protein